MKAALLGGRVRFYQQTHWVWAVLGTGPVVLLLFVSALLGDPFLGRNPLLVLGSVPFIFAFFVCDFLRRSDYGSRARIPNFYIDLVLLLLTY